MSALTLCTVQDPARALLEVRRVLRPGGRLRALEHVRSPHPVVAIGQRALNPLWGRVAGGCRLDRPTASLIEAAGLRLVSRQCFLGDHLEMIDAEHPAAS